MQNLDTLRLRMKDGKVCAHTGIVDAPECIGRKPFHSWQMSGYPTFQSDHAGANVRLWGLGY